MGTIGVKKSVDRRKSLLLPPPSSPPFFLYSSFSESSSLTSSSSTTIPTAPSFDFKLHKTLLQHTLFGKLLLDHMSFNTLFALFTPRVLKKKEIVVQGGTIPKQVIILLSGEIQNDENVCWKKGDILNVEKILNQEKISSSIWCSLPKTTVLVMRSDHVLAVSLRYLTALQRNMLLEVPSTNIERTCTVINSTESSSLTRTKSVLKTSTTSTLMGGTKSEKDLLHDRRMKRKATFKTPSRYALIDEIRESQSLSTFKASSNTSIIIDLLPQVHVNRLPPKLKKKNSVIVQSFRGQAVSSLNIKK